MDYLYDDGGRAAAGYAVNKNVGDCVTRAIAIATGKNYAEVYESLFSCIKEYATTHMDRTAKRIARGNGRKGTTPRNGVHKNVYTKYLASLGWKWTPLMGIGTGCKVHLRKEELPSGTIIARLSKHIVTVIDGVIHDTYDPSREGTRCVYGYWTKGA